MKPDSLKVIESHVEIEINISDINKNASSLYEELTKALSFHFKEKPYKLSLRVFPLDQLTSLKPSEKQDFMEKVTNIIQQNMSKPDLTIEHFLEHFFLCRTLFYKKLEFFFNMTPHELIKKLG